MANAKTIKLAGNFRHEEYLTAAGITPGHLVQMYNAAGTAKVRVHPTAGGRCEAMFACEDALRGETIDDAYVSGDLVPVAIAEKGAVVQAYLKDGENVVIGDELVSAGDGTLIKSSSLASSGLLLQVVAYAVEALDLSASANTAAGRIDVRVA